MIALEVISPSTSRLQSVASSVPIGQRGLVHIWGRNDTSGTQGLGIALVVRDPNGAVVEEYSDWSYGHGPGDDHQFIGGRFDLDNEGTYTLAVDLLMGGPGNPVVVDSYQGDLCTTTTEVPPEYELLEETVYPYAYIYDGEAEASTFTFTSLPFTPASWIAGDVAAKVEAEVRKAGGRIMEMRVYVDESLWRPWTNWRIDVVGVPSTGVAGPVGIAWWGVAILAALAIALIIVITWSVKTVVALFRTKPGLHEVKPAWGKETLILTIQDADEYWERPPTPVETLEGMSEEELREHLDQIAEEEVPSEISPWGMVALVGVVAVLGVGAAVVLSKRPVK